MLLPPTPDPLHWAWLGAVLLLCGETAAAFSVRNLARLIVLSTIAELGYVLLGAGLGGVGATGAVMHFGYQAVMRGLMAVTAWWLIRRTGSSELKDLAGSARRMPVATTLFGFGTFSVMGLSPFKGSFSKFLILYAAIEQGQWLLAAAGTLASIIAAIYYMIVIQRVCFEPERRGVVLAAPPAWTRPTAAVLAAATVVMSLWPAPFLGLAEAVAGVGAPRAVPQFESPWASLALVPYVSGFVLYGLGRFSVRARDVAAVALAAATLALAWLDPGLDPLSRLFALLVAAVMLAVVIYSTGYMARAAFANSYWFFLFLLSGSLIGVATAHEFGNFYVFWELMTWTSYFLVIHDRTAPALRAGFVYFVMCTAGAYVMQFGILLLHAQAGSFEMGAIARAMDHIGAPVGMLAALCFLVGFAVKAGLVPVQQWLPLAHPAAPSSISAPLSGILTKAGIFGLAKVLFGVFGAAALARLAARGCNLELAIIALGLATMVFGDLRALFEQDIKRMLAYSTIAQIGEIVAVLGLGTPLAATAALLHVTNHAAMKSLLFLGVGALIWRSGRRRIAELAGLGRVMPISAGCYVLATLAIMGLPPFSGFVSKFLMIYAAAAAGNLLVAATLLAGSLVGCFYYLRVARLLFFHPYAGPAVAEAPASMLAAMGVLAAAILIGGLAPQLQLGLIRPAVAAIMPGGALAVPDLTMAWTPAAVIAALGSVAVWAIGRRSIAWSGALAVAVLLAALVAVALQPGRYDPLSFWFAVLIAGVGACNMLHATGYLAHSHAQPRLFASFGLMIAGLLGMTASTNAFTFFAFWELMSSWALYFAIIHDETEDARREGFKYFIFNAAGASLMFLGFAMLAAAAGSFDFAAIGRAALASPLAWTGSALVAVFAGLVMKAAQLPIRIDYQMHPATAPTPVSGYISAVLLKSGHYGLLKLFTAFGGAVLAGRLGVVFHMPLLMYVIAVIGGITILYAGAMAVIQTGIKRLLIYSTVSQLGYIMMAIALGSTLGVAGGLMHLVNHMMLKNTLFLTAGCIMAATHATTLDELGGLARRMPITFGCFLFAGLSLAGLPPLNGFASKWLIFQAAFESGHPLLGIAAMVGSLLTLAAVLKFAHAAFLGAPSVHSLTVHEAPASMLVPIGVLVTGSVIVGVFPGLLLVPIGGIEQALGLAPVVATLTGPLPGLGGWHPGVLWVLLLVTAGFAGLYVRSGRAGGVLLGTHIHQCGVSDIALTATRVGAASLFETTEKAIRLVLQPARER